ncbi:TPA: hypothetical protein ACT5CI_003065 [Edwardsiella tarda]
MEKVAEATAVKFCQICGDTMHQENRDGGLWWVCDDPTCDFQILIKSASGDGGTVVSGMK